jgi:hypothetical protein
MEKKISAKVLARGMLIGAGVIPDDSWIPDCQSLAMKSSHHNFTS